MFHVLDEERKWRIANNRPQGFGSLAAFPPVVALGAECPLEQQVLVSDFFHGRDGLGGVQTDVCSPAPLPPSPPPVRMHARDTDTRMQAPHFTPAATWQHITSISAPAPAPAPPNFIPTTTPAHLKMLELLRAHPVDTITIVALGPLTNLARAAESDPEAFLRAREVVAMGGAIDVAGNVTPAAEFNHYACAWSAARVYALSAPHPTSTLPPAGGTGTWTPYPDGLSRTLNLTIVPLDITTRHVLDEAAFRAVVAPLAEAGSPLAAWTSVFLAAAFERMREVYLAGGSGTQSETGLELHDPLCVWYLLSLMRGDSWAVAEARDVRIDATGQWTRGMCVVDRRAKRVERDLDGDLLLGDVGGWLHAGYGNRVRQVLQSPAGHERGFAGELLARVFA